MEFRGVHTEANRMADRVLLEEEIVLASLREIVGSTRTTEEVDAEYFKWRNYGKV